MTLESDPDPRMQSLRARYTASLPGKRDNLRSALMDWQQRCDESSLQELSMQVHRLCGSAGAYGYAAIGQLACAADRLIDAATSPAALVDVLPRAITAVIDALAAAAPCNPAPHVLVIDDDPAQAMLIATRLESSGYRVHVEHDGANLLRAVTERRFDAVLLDYWLCGETALDLVASLRRTPQPFRLGLVCLTGESDPVIRRTILDAGCDAVLGKDEPFERVRDALDASIAAARARIAAQ